MLKKLILVAILSTCLVFSGALVAQDKFDLAYGDTVEGEITDDEYEISYLFRGSEDDIVIIEMKPVELASDLTSSGIRLLDQRDRVIADTIGGLNIFGSVLAIQLPADGNYTIVATRSQGSRGDSVGEFRLRLINPIELAPGDSLSDEVATGESTDYYWINGSRGDEITLYYQRDRGSFAPEISINEIGSLFSGLTSTVSLRGEDLEYGAINIPTDNGIYIIQVGESTLAFAFGNFEMGYTLTIEEGRPG